MKKKEKKLMKENKRKAIDAAYQITSKDLENKDVRILEKTLDRLEDTFNRNFETLKNYDNKASLLLVIYVGIFSIFACFLSKINFQNTPSKIIFAFLFGATVLSYVVSIIFLTKTIRTYIYKVSTPLSICLPSKITDYRVWLILQIKIKSSQILQNKKASHSKVVFYNVGRICLIVSVILTLLSASFVFYCNLLIK